MEDNKQVYIAGGWFSEEQMRAVQTIEQALDMYNIKYISPRNFVYDGVMDPSIILDTNIQDIDRSNLIIASTVGKDMGTLFECGYAYGQGIKIAYYFPIQGAKFNIMLATSGVAVLSDTAELTQFLQAYSKGQGYKKEWKGELE